MWRVCSIVSDDYSSGEDSRAKPTLRVVAVEFKLFQIIKGRLKPVFRRPFRCFTSLQIQIRTNRGSRRLRPRRFSRRRVRVWPVPVVRCLPFGRVRRFRFWLGLIFCRAFCVSVRRCGRLKRFLPPDWRRQGFQTAFPHYPANQPQRINQYSSKRRTAQH